MTSKLNVLLGYKPGGEQATLFEQKLQEQTGWDSTFCKGAIDEYLRFLYLASISRTTLTPSSTVDKVWHLHLTFSRCYWDGLCAKVLGRNLHHDPAMPSDQNVMSNQYLRTLNMYKIHFREAPPHKFWPLPKSKVRRPSKMSAMFLIFISVCLGATAAASTDHNESSIGFWLVFGVLGFIIVLLIFTAKGSRRRGNDSGGAWYTGNHDSKHNDGGCSSGDAGGCGGGGGCGGS